MQDNRWLYFIVGGLAVVALIFFGVFYKGPADEGSPQVQIETPAAPPSGTAAGDSAGATSGDAGERKSE